MTKKNAKEISSKINPIPDQIGNLMQGICYWVGHRRAYYRHHHLVEGAVVGELANLINANISRDEKLSCEVP